MRNENAEKFSHSKVSKNRKVFNSAPVSTKNTKTDSASFLWILGETDIAQLLYQCTHTSRRLGLGANPFNPSTWEAAPWVQSQPCLYSEFQVSQDLVSKREEKGVGKTEKKNKEVSLSLVHGNHTGRSLVSLVAFVITTNSHKSRRFLNMQHKENKTGPH